MASISSLTVGSDIAAATNAPSAPSSLSTTRIALISESDTLPTPLIRSLMGPCTLSDVVVYPGLRSSQNRLLQAFTIPAAPPVARTAVAGLP